MVALRFEPTHNLIPSALSYQLIYSGSHEKMICGQRKATGGDQHFIGPSRPPHAAKEHKKNEAVKKGGKIFVNGESKGSSRKKIDIGREKDRFL